MSDKSINPFTLEGKQILVTGATSGIGRACAILCSKMGAAIIGTGRDESRLESLKKEIQDNKGQIEIKKCDLTVPNQLEELVNTVSNLDGLVLSAGKALTLPTQFSDLTHFMEVFQINLFSAVELSRLLYKKKKLNRESSIVAIASIGGITRFAPGNGIYGASKAALNSFMKFEAKEFSSRKIRVNTVCPALVDTPMTKGGSITREQMEEDICKYPLKRFGEPEDVANAVVFLLSNGSSWITGTSLLLDGGVSLN